MAKKKQPIKAKEPIKIRFKSLANGNQSIYLDSYVNGKRSYEFLNLYIVPEVNQAARAQNANTLQAANAIKSQKILSLANQKAGIKTDSGKGKMLLTDWLSLYKDGHERKGKYTKHITQLIAAVTAYKGDRVMMKDVDKAYCLGFIDYIQHEYRTAAGKPLQQQTAHNYNRNLSIVLKAAAIEGIIPENPFNQISPDDKIQAPREGSREYLTINEVKKLIETPFSRNQVKQAYLFSVFCGLRYSDVESLTWGQVIMDGGQARLNVIMKKTKDALYLPLSKDALKWLPDRGTKSEDERVFDDLPRNDFMNILLGRWAKDAGIAKHVTFHTARHTFATMMLTLGAELYTTSKLLGHKDVATTQIYAKIVDKKKDEAVNLVNGLFD